MLDSRLSSDEQSLLDNILANNLDTVFSDLTHTEKSLEIAKTLLTQINHIIHEIGTLWNSEHDLKGSLIVEKETITSDEITLLYDDLEPLFELIRSRFPILRSEKRIAVGTLVNVHQVSQLLELALRKQGYLTYYWGTHLTTRDVKDKNEVSPANIFVLSCMAVNSENNVFEELQILRNTFPEVKIIVGGAAFQMFLVLKEDKNHPALTEPYKINPEYYEEITKSSNLKNFVLKVFNVSYCETIDEIINEIKQ